MCLYRLLPRGSLPGSTVKRVVVHGKCIQTHNLTISVKSTRHWVQYDKLFQYKLTFAVQHHNFSDASWQGWVGEVQSPPCRNKDGLIDQGLNKLQKNPLESKQMTGGMSQSIISIVCIWQ